MSNDGRKLYGRKTSWIDDFWAFISFILISIWKIYKNRVSFCYNLNKSLPYHQLCSIAHNSHFILNFLWGSFATEPAQRPISICCFPFWDQVPGFIFTKSVENFEFNMTLTKKYGQWQYTWGIQEWRSLQRGKPKE